MKLKKLIYNYLPLDVKVFFFKRKKMDKPCGYGEVYRDTLNKAFDTFLTPEERCDKKLVEMLTDDIVKCWLKYKALPYEYFLFNFRNRSENERWEFETDIDRLLTLCRVSDDKLFKEEINNKYNFYQLAKPYFKRNVIKIDSKGRKMSLPLS